MLLSQCKLCNSQNIYSRYKLSRYHLVLLRCRDCGFIFTDYINTNYLTPTVTQWDFEGHAENLTKKFYGYSDHITRYFNFNQKKILDVGAGGGDFLFQAKLRGADPVGLDLDLTGIQFAKEKYDIIILPSLVEEAALVSESFDAVSMWEVIEHVNDPQSTVAAIARLLKQGGWFFLSTPCLDSLWDRIGFFLYGITFGLIEFPLRYRFSWAHLQIFSRKHLTQLLERNGFTIEYFEQRTEFTYPTEIYLQKIKPVLFRKILAKIWDWLNKIIPIGNKMIVYAKKL